MLFNFQTVLEKINQEISSYKFGSSPPELYEPIQYILELGGKRMRPILTNLGNFLYSDNIEKSIKASVAVEIFHNFTLMHDDIMDHAPIRRGKATVHEKWNTNTAILSGDVMLVKAYELLLELDEKILKKGIILFNQCAAGVCEGQQLDVNYETKAEVSVEEYLEMIRLKTAVLLGFSLEFGGLIGGADEKNLNLLRNLGVNIGLGFQLKDDLLDVYGDQKKFGKQVGGDIISNKKTFLLIQAINKAQGNDKKRLGELLKNDTDPEQKVSEVTSIYNSLEIPEITKKKIDECFLEGFKCLSKIDAPLYKKNILKEFITKLIDRDN